MKNILFSTTMFLSFVGLLILSDDGKKFNANTDPPDTNICTPWGIWQDLTPCAGPNRVEGTKTQRRTRECTDGLTPIGGTPIYRPEYEYRVIECEILVDPFDPFEPI